MSKDKVALPSNKKLKKGFDPSVLKDAFFGGELTCPIGTELVISRFRNGKEILSICTIKSVQENGLIHTWDETIQQWFVFSRFDLPRVIKVNESNSK